MTEPSHPSHPSHPRQSSQPEVPQLARVARDLTAVLDLHEALRDQAIARASAAEIPGGGAMYALGSVANLEAWEHLHQTDERLGRAYTSAEDEDPEEAWSPYQLLEFWSEAWRREREAEWGEREMRHSVHTEAMFLRTSLEWAWSNELHFDDFAADMARARRKLEDILHAGERVERGAPCMYDECDGVRLVRKLVPDRGPEGEKVWRLSDWHCPSCKRSWDEDSYARMITAAHELTKFEDIDGERWCSIDYAARQTRRPESTLRSWLHRGHLAEVCILAGRRRFIRLSDALAKAGPRDESPRCNIRTATTEVV